LIATHLMGLRKELWRWVQENVQTKFVGILNVTSLKQAEIERSMTDDTQQNRAIRFTVQTNHEDGRTCFVVSDHHQGAASIVSDGN